MGNDKYESKSIKESVSTFAQDEFISYMLLNLEDEFAAKGIIITKGRSPKGGKSFLKIIRDKWAPEPLIVDNKELHLSIHLESNSNANGLLLHFETDAYIPYGDLEAKYGSDFMKKYNLIRDNYRRLFENDSEYIHKNWSLTVAFFLLPNEQGLEAMKKEILTIVKLVDETVLDCGYKV